MPRRDHRASVLTGGGSVDGGLVLVASQLELERAEETTEVELGARTVEELTGIAARLTLTVLWPDAVDARPEEEP